MLEEKQTSLVHLCRFQALAGNMWGEAGGGEFLVLKFGDER